MKAVPQTATAQGKIVGSQQRSQIRINQILKAAHRILITEGYHSLSLRKLAQQLGISNGNVTYYFPNKQVLLRALIEDVLNRYDAEFRAEAEKFPNDPEKRISAYFDYLIKDAQQPDSRSFFYQLWGLSTHHPVAAALRDEVYNHFLSRIEMQVRSLRPDLKPQQLRNKCLLLMSLVEGLNVMLGSGKPFLNQFKGIKRYFHDQIITIVRR